MALLQVVVLFTVVRSCTNPWLFCDTCFKIGLHHPYKHIAPSVLLSLFMLK